MSDTIGARLRQAREQRDLELEQVSELTRIRLHYLRALEADDYSLIPSAAQARGFLRNYAEFLDVDLGQAIADVQRAHPQPAEGVSGPLPKVDILPDSPRPLLPQTEAELNARTEPVVVEPAAARGPGWLDRIRGAFARPAPDPALTPESQAADDNAPDPLPEDVQAAAPIVEAAAVRAAEADSARAEAQAEDEERVQAEPDAGKVSVWSRIRSLFYVRPRSESAELEGADEGEDPMAVRTLAAAETVIEKPEDIFIEIGAMLRKRRELLSLTLEEVERHIRVRAVYVKALEDGAFDRLPSAVQTRGMLSSYAGFLDLDTEALLLRFADAIQAGHRLRYPEKPGSAKSPIKVSPHLPPLRSFIAGDLIFGVAMAGLLVTMAIWGLNRVFAIQAEEAVLPTAPSISDVLATSQQPTVEQQVTLIAADTPLPSGAESVAAVGTPDIPEFDVTISVQITITVVERTFLRVIVDGEEALNGRVLAGASYTYEAAESIEVLTGNAAALTITYNGRDLGLMGNFGEVANRIYTADGVVTPTPAAPATATPSPVITGTPTATGSSPNVTPSPASVGD